MLSRAHNKVLPFLHSSVISVLIYDLSRRYFFSYAILVVLPYLESSLSLMWSVCVFLELCFE